VKASLVLLLFGKVETGLLFKALPKDYFPELNSWKQGKPRSAGELVNSSSLRFAVRFQGATIFTQTECLLDPALLIAGGRCCL
jgi:hypothetical protein